MAWLKRVLTFAPPVLLGSGTYWIGVSGNGFEAGQLSMVGDPGGDNLMAQFAGTSFLFMTSVGDQSFQLFGRPETDAVPEPTSLTLLGTLVAAFSFCRYRRIGRTG